jgi:hypothetical protein
VDRAALKTLIQAAGYGTTTADTNAQDKALDAVLLELSAEREWSWLFVTASGTMTVNATTISKPADLVVPKGVFPSFGTTKYDPLTELSAEEMRINQHLDVGTGLPAWWAWVDRTIAIWPRPDIAYAYRLDYVKEPDTAGFSAGTDSPPFSKLFHPVMAWGAIRWLAFRQRDLWSYWNATDEYKQAKLNFSQADRSGDQLSVKQWAGWEGHGV